jgi:hypothetical protein
MNFRQRNNIFEVKLILIGIQFDFRLDGFRFQNEFIDFLLVNRKSGISI